MWWVDQLLVAGDLTSNSLFVTCFLIGFGVTTFGTLLTFFPAIRELLKKTDRAIGPQRIHDSFTPRIGGLFLWLGITCAFAVWSHFAGFSERLAQLFIPITLSFLLGFIEDVSNAVSATKRLVGSLLIGFIFIWLNDLMISRTNVDVIDLVLVIPAVGIVITALAISTFINALNIIDGLNGLALKCSILFCASFAMLAGQVNDTFLFSISACRIIGYSLPNRLNFVTVFPEKRVLIVKPID